MRKPEFVALQVTMLVRSDEAKSREVEAFLDSVAFKYEMQENMARLVQASLAEHEVPFEEVIISLDKPAERAKPVEKPRSSADKASFLGRLLGR